MDFKTIVVGYFTLLVLITLFTTITSSLKIVAYIDEISIAREDVFIIIDYSSRTVYLVKYIVYEINIYDQSLYYPRLRISHLFSNYFVNEAGVKNIVIEIGSSNSTPVIPPKTILDIGEYSMLIKKRYGLEQIYSGLENTTVYPRKIRAKYLIVVTMYVIDSDKYIDFSKYTPPIIYYPKELVLNTTISRFIEYSIEDVAYSSTLKYSINTLLNDYCSTSVMIEYVLTPVNPSYKFLAISWILLLTINEYRKPRAIFMYSKEIFCKLRSSLSYILRKLRALVRYIHELSRV